MRVHLEDIGLIDDFMASDDLNECVEALLHKRPKHSTAIGTFKVPSASSKLKNRPSTDQSSVNEDFHSEVNDSSQSSAQSKQK